MRFRSWIMTRRRSGGLPVYTVHRLFHAIAVLPFSTVKGRVKSTPRFVHQRDTKAGCTRVAERVRRRGKLCSSEEDAFGQLVECDSPPWPTDCQPKASSTPPSLPSSLSLSSSLLHASLHFSLTSAGIFRRPRIKLPRIESTPPSPSFFLFLSARSKLYLDDTRSMLPVCSSETRTGEGDLDAVFDCCLEMELWKNGGVRSTRGVVLSTDWRKRAATTLGCFRNIWNNAILLG